MFAGQSWGTFAGMSMTYWKRHSLPWLNQSTLWKDISQLWSPRVGVIISMSRADQWGCQAGLDKGLCCSSACLIIYFWVQEHHSHVWASTSAMKYSLLQACNHGSRCKPSQVCLSRSNKMGWIGSSWMMFANECLGLEPAEIFETTFPKTQLSCACFLNWGNWGVPLNHPSLATNVSRWSSKWCRATPCKRSHTEWLVVFRHVSFSLIFGIVGCLAIQLMFLGWPISGNRMAYNHQPAYIWRAGSSHHPKNRWMSILTA